MECQVCQKHKTYETLPGGVIFENSDTFIAHFPLIPEQKAHYGHLILEFKRHITQPSQLSEAEALELGRWTPRVCQALEKALGAVHVYVLRIGDVTPHLHYHFVPRYKDAPRESWGPLHHNWPTGPKANESDMEQITLKLKDFLK